MKKGQSALSQDHILGWVANVLSADDIVDAEQEDESIAARTTIAAEQRTRAIVDVTSRYRVVDMRSIGVVVALIVVFGVFSK